jgi:hypothetical protein
VTIDNLVRTGVSTDGYGIYYENPAHYTTTDGPSPQEILNQTGLS